MIQAKSSLPLINFDIYGNSVVLETATNKINQKFIPGFAYSLSCYQSSIKQS